MSTNGSQGNRCNPNGLSGSEEDKAKADQCSMNVIFASFAVFCAM